jgi:hypothetical protein
MRLQQLLGSVRVHELAEGELIYNIIIAGSLEEAGRDPWLHV